MTTRRRWLIALCFACGAALAVPPALAAGEEMPAAERERVERMLDALAQARGLQFIRNGTAYDAATAVRFLRAKWDRYRSRVRTAEDFIREIAAKSETSGERYRVRRSDGSEEESAAYLTRLLAAQARKTT